MLARLHHLVVPVGALDQPHGERRPARARARPVEQPVELLRRLAQVGLEHHAGRRARRGTRARRAARAPAPSSSRARRATPCRCAGGRRAPSRGAAAGRMRAAASSRPFSGASGRMSGVSADTFTDRFTRGSGPTESASSDGRGRPPRDRRRERLQRLAGSARRSGRPPRWSRWPRRAGRPTSPRRPSHSSRSTFSAAFGDSPTMKRWAMWRTPPAAATPSARRPARDPGGPHRGLDRGRAVVDLVEVGAQVAGQVVERAAWPA